MTEIVADANALTRRGATKLLAETAMVSMLGRAVFAQDQKVVDFSEPVENLG